MLKVSLDALATLKSELEAALGVDFISQIVRASGAVGRNWGEAHRIESAAHPFAAWWRAFGQDIDTSVDGDKLVLSEQSARCLGLLSDLKDISKVVHVSRILDALRNKATFYSAVFEAHVCATYVALGYKVEVVVESVNQGVRTPDLIVRVGDSPVHVECKSLEDVPLKESSKYWTELTHRLSSLMRKHRRSWAVRISANKPVEAKELEEILNAAHIDLRNNHLQHRDVSGANFTLDYLKLSDWDQVYRGDFRMSFTEDAAVGMAGASVQREGLGMVYRNPYAITVHPHQELNLLSRILSEFKKAAGQIPKEGPGVVHISVPEKIGPRFLQIADSAYMGLYRKLNNDTQRVNAVVLSGTLLGANGQRPLEYLDVAVPNLRARSLLPSGITLPGTRDMGFRLSEEQGTVRLSVVLPEPLQVGQPATLFWHSSNDARQQIKIWRTWDGILRFDLFTPSIGMATIMATEFTPVPNRKYWFAVVWSAEEVVAYLDGEPVGRCQRTHEREG